LRPVKGILTINETETLWTDAVFQPRFTAITCTILSVFWSSASTGQEVFARPTLTLQYENDTFAGADRHYTHGTRFGLVPPQSVEDELPLIPRKFRNFLDWPGPANIIGIWLDAIRAPDLLFSDARKGAKAPVYYSYSLSQLIFTPTDMELEVPDPTQRPYAGWLALSVSLHALSNDKTKLDTVEISVGVVGPSARAGDVQVWRHRVLEIATPKGWITS
jgi:hypothetical protein